MSHFAEIDEDDMVIRVLKCTQDEINNSGLYGDSSRWIQTSYNTYGGKHYDPETMEEDGETPLRKNYAGPGYYYDRTRDAFIPPIEYPSWVVNEDTCLWEAPVPEPTRDVFLEADGTNNGSWYEWNEEKKTWDVWMWDETNEEFKIGCLFDKTENVWKKIEE